MTLAIPYLFHSLLISQYSICIIFQVLVIITLNMLFCMYTFRPSADGNDDENMEDMTDVMELDYNNDSAYDSFICIGKLKW